MERGEELVLVEGLAKAFGPTQAIRDATFELRSGEVHVLAGENGSGKSTLVKILSGVHAADSGTISLAGGPAPPLRSPRMAQDNGISTVFQEVLVAEARSVLANVWLGGDGILKARVSGREKRRRASEQLEQLLGHPLDLNTTVEDLSISDRQACGIVRALLRRPRVLILDEATSALDVATRDRLFEIVTRLSAEGVGTIFITHRMDEITQIGDRVTVMRTGSTVGTLERGKWQPQDLVHLMTGAEELTANAREAADPLHERTGDVVLSARGLKLRETTEPFDVDLHEGELIGIAGLEGHGQDDFLQALRGMRPFAGDVIRRTDGQEQPVRSTHEAAKRQIAYVPRERGTALFRWMSIRENFGMPTLSKDRRGGLLSLGATRTRLDEYIERLSIILGKESDAITTLSGGNQQKVVIGRWLAANPKILLLNDPTRGIDVGAKRELYALLADLASEGLAVVMLSSELDEHVELMDRVLVFREHELSAEIPRADLSREALVSAFFGQERNEKHVGL
jgi:ABC-type sugar transport system ATPase subunit